MLSKFISSQNRIIVILLLIVGLVIAVLLSRQSQNSASHAALDQTLDHINFSNIRDSMSTSDQPLHISAQGVNANNEIIDGVFYTWGISSNGSIGRLIETSQNITGFQPLNPGSGDIWVTAIKNGVTLTKSFRMTVTSTSGITPTPNKVPISWKTAHASLAASDFYIMANGKKFTSSNASVRVISDPAGPPYFDKTTLEATWFENGVEMRLFLYFSLDRTNNLWKIYDIRTYDGTNNNSWIYYHGFSGNFVGQSYHNSSLNLSSYLPQFPDSPLTGSIHFENVNIQAFLIPPFAFPNGYYIYSQDALSIPVFDGNTFPNLWPFLYNNGVFVTDQTHLAYQWSVHDGNVADIQPERICQSADMVAPCPESLVTVKGIKPGVTTINLTIVNLLTNTVLASKTFGLTVYASTSPTPTPGSSTTRVTLPLLLHGVGKGGDNVNPNSTGTTNPVHPTRTVTVSLIDGSQQIVKTVQGNIIFDTSTGSFNGTIDLGSNFPTGFYTVRAKTPNYIDRQIGLSFYNITQGQTTPLNTTPLVVGDSNNDNHINILDYNMLLDCYSSIEPAKNCNPTKFSETDLNDDGQVNQFDYNLLLRELSSQG